MTATFLAALMWRRPVNSAALAITTYRKMEEVFNGTITQVRVQINNKCKAMMASRRLYKKRSPHEERDREKGEEKRGTENNWRLKARTSKYSSHLLGLRIYGH